MLEVNFPIGNIFCDKGFEYLKLEDSERLQMSRLDLEKRVLRKTSDRGTDVGLKLEQGVKIQHGDVIECGNRKIVIEQLPEKVISVKLKTKYRFDIVVLLGHIVGNRHRPISIRNEEITFPIQAESEKEIFMKLFHDIIDHIEIKVEEKIFLPHSSANVHEH